MTQRALAPAVDLPAWLPELSGRRIAVLGADGFIGSHLVVRALAAGAAVTALCVKDPWRLRSLDDRRLTFAAVGGGRWWTAEYQRELPRLLEGADALALLAYEPPPAADEARRYEHERTVNARGAAAVAAAASRAGVRVVFASSADVYGTWFERPVTEETPPRPVTPYARAKLEAEALLTESCGEHAVTCLRIATVFGAGENGPRAIPSFARALHRGEIPAVHGDGADVRDYVHVGDVAAAIAAAGGAPSVPATVINVGSGVGRTTLEVLRSVAAVLGVEPKPRFVASARHPSRLVLDVLQATRLLGFQPRQDFEEALREEVRWLLEPVSAGSAP